MPCVKPISKANHFQRLCQTRWRDSVSYDQDVYAIEAPLYSDKLKIAGRTDVIGKFDNINSVIDYKTSTRPKKPEWVENYWLQLAIYNYMFAEIIRDRKLIPTQLVLLISVEGETEPQIMTQQSSVWVPKALEYVENYYRKKEFTDLAIEA